MNPVTDGVRDGHVKIRVSDDLMKAEVDLFPPVSGGAGITIMTVLSELELAGVSWGIDKEHLEKSILRCLTEEVALRGVVAAKGQKADKSVPSYWHLKKRLIQKPNSDKESPNVDYRDKSPYILVKQGEPIAKQIPESPGAPGRNTAGDILPVSEKEIVQYKPGENVVEKDGVLYASCHGRFEIRERLMTVNETLDIPGNVDYSTGHIAFPGDVIIHGAVCDGFRVAAGKSIFVKQTMDASKVLSRGDLVVEGGIKGRGEALVRVDGRVAAKFIENASVEAHGDIVVEKAVMHTNVYTLNHLDLGEDGVLVGGDIWAMKGLRTGSIGRPESPSAHIRVGSDYIASRKLENIRAQIDRLETKVDRLKAKPTINAKREELIGQVDNVLVKLAESEQELIKDLNRNHNSKVIVCGSVDEGTEITIAELTLRISSPMEGVVFYYEADGPRIATRSITDSDKKPLPELDEKTDSVKQTESDAAADSEAAPEQTDESEKPGSQPDAANAEPMEQAADNPGETPEA